MENEPFSSRAYSVSLLGSMYALLQIRGVVVIHNPRSSSRGQSLSSLEFLKSLLQSNSSEIGATLSN
eukprot:14167698-Ditylum_brightwellii.AAC.1